MSPAPARSVEDGPWVTVGAQRVQSWTVGCPYMYVRFRQRNARLLVSLVASRRVEGRHQKEHIGFLGSVPIPAAAADRVWFWQQLPQRLSRLANRTGDEQGKLMAAIHARIPMFTQDELQAVKILEAEADKSWWERIRDMN